MYDKRVFSCDLLPTFINEILDVSYVELTESVLRELYD